MPSDNGRVIEAIMALLLAAFGCSGWVGADTIALILFSCIILMLIIINIVDQTGCDDDSENNT